MLWSRGINQVMLARLPSVHASFSLTETGTWKEPKLEFHNFEMSSRDWWYCIAFNMEICITQSNLPLITVVSLKQKMLQNVTMLMSQVLFTFIFSSTTLLPCLAGTSSFQGGGYYKSWLLKFLRDVIRSLQNPHGPHFKQIGSKTCLLCSWSPQEVAQTICKNLSGWKIV